jgi:hypothetical protein
MNGLDVFAVAALLATCNKALIDYLFAPLHKRFANVDFWWKQYVALITGGLIGWFAVGDMFANYVTEPLVSQALTAVLIGGGSGLINRVFGKI